MEQPISIFPLAEWLHQHFSIQMLELMYDATRIIAYILIGTLILSWSIMTYKNIKDEVGVFSTMDFVWDFLKFAVLFTLNAILNQSLIETI